MKPGVGNTKTNERCLNPSFLTKRSGLLGRPVRPRLGAGNLG